MAQKKKNKRRRRQFQQKVILSVLLVIIIGLIGVLGYQMQKNEKKQTDGNASASSSVSSSSLAGDSSEPISDSSPEEEITPTPEPVQQISSDGLNSQHALLVRESDLAEMMNLGGDERIYPASMTKIMTALLTIENLPDLNETITVPEDIFEELTAQDASVAGFNPYEQPTVRDLLYGVLLPSGADACETLARAVGGSEEGFVAMMNQKAEERGLTNTHFENCTGLHNDNHYSTCRDIAVLMSECLKSDTFREIVTREVYTTEATASHPEGITLYDTMLHRFTSYEMSTTLENGAVIEGGKTGFTDEAGQCLVSFAEYGGEEYILVTAEAMTDSGSAVAGGKRMSESMTGKAFEINSIFSYQCNHPINLTLYTVSANRSFISLVKYIFIFIDNFGYPPEFFLVFNNLKHIFRQRNISRRTGSFRCILV